MSKSSDGSRQIGRMSVEDSLRYFDDTVAALDLSQNRFPREKHAYGSESDLLSEIGYASGYTELSATSDGEEQAKQHGGGIRRRKSRQNRNQRFQCDPILGDLESDSTNDGRLFGSSATPRVKTKTNSGQRRQRERRRQRRQNANRNSWTDSGLSLSKTDSQRSSHSENSPVKRGRSKTSPAEMVNEDGIAVEVIDEKEAMVGEKLAVQTDSGVSSPGLSVSSPTQDECFEAKGLDDSTASFKGDAEVGSEKQVAKSRASLAGRSSKSLKSKDDVFDLSASNVDEKPVASSSVANSLDSRDKKNDYNFIDMKPTNWQGVVNGTYTPKEKEILHQVLENARNSAKESPRGASKFPLPPHLDYPFCMLRQNNPGRKEKKSGGLMKGLKKLKQGIANKRQSLIVGDEVGKTKSSQPTSHADKHLPPSKPVDKKKGLFKRIFKSGGGDSKSKMSTNFQRGRFSSSRSFSGSVSQLFSRGNRARSQSVENLKNYFRRDRGPSMKRTNSSVSLAAKMTRSLSVSSLVGRRNGFTRQGSMVSIAGQFSRPSNGGFRRADSVRSLHGGYDIATRMLEPRNTQRQENCFEDPHYNAQQVAPHLQDFNAPFRVGWRPASRISRREPYGYEFSPFYDDGSVIAYSDCYDNEEPCPCCCDDTYNDDGAYYNELYEHSMEQYYDQRDIYDSRVTLANMDNRYVNTHFTRAPSVRSMNLPPRPQSHAASYYSPANIRRDVGVVVAPLNVQITQERRAEKRQLARQSRVFDTFV